MTCSLPCYDCYACRPGREWADFQGLLAKGNVGLTIYRYRPPPDRNRTGRVARELYILYTTVPAGSNTDMNNQYGRMNPEDLPKCSTYCPRCQEMMRRVDALYNRTGHATQPSDLREMFSCPPCADIVRKFRNFVAGTSIRQHDSELIHLLRPMASDIKFKLKRFFSKAGVFKTVGEGLKDKDGNIIYKDLQGFEDEASSLIYQKTINKHGKDEKGIYKDEGKSFKEKDENVKYREGISKDLAIGKERGIFKDIYGSLKDDERINKDGGKSFIDKDESVKYREGMGKGTGKAVSGAALLPEKFAGKTRGREAKMSKTGNIEVTTGKHKGRYGAQGSETSKTSGFKGTTGKAGKAREGQDKGTTGKAGKAREGQDKGTTGKARERQDTQGRNVETSKISNLKGTTRKAKRAEAPSSKTGEINKDIKLGKERNGKERKSTDEGRKATKKLPSVTRKKVSDKNELKNELKIMAKALAEKKKQKPELSPVDYLIRMKIAEHMRNAPKAQEAAEKEMARAAKARQAQDERLQLLVDVAGDKESVDRTEDEIETPQYEEGQYDIIKGNRIYKMSKSAAADKVEPALELQSVKSWAAPPVSPLTVDNITVQGSKYRGNGGVRYTLSERKYIDKGWTILPREIIMRKVPKFLMRPARQNYDWLEVNKNKKLLVYPSGELLATFDETKTQLYYRSGEVALEFYKKPETSGDRVVVYSSGLPVAGRAQPRTMLAVFDACGNGAVYDHAGQIRLKYSQSEGVVVDRTLGPNTHWKWHNLCDDRLLATVLKENQPLIKDQRIVESGVAEGVETDFEKPIPPDDYVMRGIETQKIRKEVKQLIKNYAPFQIKMKAVKINEHFALKIFQQSSIVLSFTDGKTHLRINVGMVLDPNVVVGEEFEDIGELPSVIDQVARSESVERLQRVVQGARSVERENVLRERRLNITPSFLLQKNKKKRRVKSPFTLSNPISVVQSK